MKTATQLRQERAALVARGKALFDGAKDRELSAEEQSQVDSMKAEIAAVNQSITAAERREGDAAQFDQLAAELGAPQPPATRLPDGPATTVRETFQSDPKRGYAHARAFLQDVLAAGRHNRVSAQLRSLQVAPRAAAGADEQGTFHDAYGGFLVPTGLLAGVLTIEAEDDPSFGRTTMVAMDTDLVKIPARVDKNHAASVSGGLRVYRRAESQPPPATRLELEMIALEATMLMGIAYSSEELLARSPSTVFSLIQGGFRDEFAARHLNEVIRGTGVGEFLGVLNSPALITASKEAGPQPADTIVYANLVKMRARAWRYGRCIWLANHDTIPQLMTIASADNAHIWQPNAREDIPSTLLGRPIFFSEFCETLGDKGDIMLVDLSQYLEGELTPLQGAESIHARFDAHERAFKFWKENAGAPWWRSALSPKKGANTLSPFVVLEAR